MAYTVEFFKLQSEEYGFSIVSDLENLDKDEKLIIFNKINEWKRKYMTLLKSADIKWNKALLKENRYEHIRDLKQLCRLGIPANRRPKVWFSLSGAAEKFNKNPFLFDTTMNDLTRKFNDNFEAVNQINRDVERTFPSHPYFQATSGIDSLRMLLCAFVFHRPQISYCQSMNFLAGIFLLMFPNDLNKALFMLIQLIDVILPPDYYTSKMVGVYCDLLSLDELLAVHAPLLSDHLKDLGIELQSVCLSWFSCVFILSMPIETVFRIWDVVMAEGSEFMFRIALALFMLHEKELLALDEPSLIFSYVKDIGRYFYDCDKLITFAQEINIKHNLKALRTDNLVKVQLRLEHYHANRH